jgi:M6 family metalloprotease-like protein
MKRAVVVSLIFLFSASSASGGDETLLRCGVRSERVSTHALDDIGGKHITARGVFRILLVFASFPDDSTPHPFWPARSAPLFMQQFIDPDTNTHSTNSFNLTNYFRQMSLGQLHVIGEAIWVQSAHSQEEYRDGAFWRANKHILPESVDPVVNFAQYDSWTRQGDFIHANTPDGLVDMIVMVWRTNIFAFLGEASLGYQPGFNADGKRIEMGFPEYLPRPIGSGITCEYLYGDAPFRAMQVMVHELSHWLLGGPHPYNSESLHGKHSYWGMLCNQQRHASCVNAYERERLGWTTVPEISANQTVTLTDFLTTGAAYKFHPPNGEPFEFFYIENHQKLSVLDDATGNAADKGVWILQQEGPYMEVDNFRIRPSDGNWRWANPGSTSQCSGQTVPIFRKGEPAIATGESHRDQIPNNASAINWMRAYLDPSGQLNCGNFATGELFNGAFNATTSNVFSFASNPTSNTWSNLRSPFSLEILSETNGVVTVRHNSNPLDASPARRHLSADPTIITRDSGRVYLAWGSQWSQGQLLEEDVSWSELQRQIGNGEWENVYTGAATAWNDGSIRYDSAGTIAVRFRARVLDTRGKYSMWSSTYYTAMIRPDYVGNDGSVENYRLLHNYPNPFNPTTTISFSLGKRESVTLTMFDVAGRPIATLIKNADMSSGTHSSSWDGRDENGSFAASGVYFCRIQTDSFSALRKMVLIR